MRSCQSSKKGTPIDITVRGTVYRDSGPGLSQTFVKVEDPASTESFYFRLGDIKEAYKIIPPLLPGNPVPKDRLGELPQGAVILSSSRLGRAAQKRANNEWYATGLIRPVRPESWEGELILQTFGLPNYNS